MACKKKEIRDIVYEYVHFTEIEEVVIEEPLFQRLRFVYQNSCAYLTYPSNQLTRFSHSLGVMHLGGEMFKTGISNSTEDDYFNFLDFTFDLINKIIFSDNNEAFQAFIAKWNTEIQNIGDFPSKKLLDKKLSPEEYLFLSNYLWQSVRIACLIHDIGHFPFSHIFEMGIEHFENKGIKGLPNPIENYKNTLVKVLGISRDDLDKEGPTKLHEFFGAYILKLFGQNFKDSVDGFPFFFYKCLLFSEIIFLTDRDIHFEKYQEQDPHEVILSLHNIISSDIDADRLDYVLRDAMSSGINIGNFDYKRLINNSKIFGYYKEGAEKEENKRFGFFITDKALSSIEQFFNHRYLLYQYLYFHHNVSKYDGILINVISILIEEAINKKEVKLLEILGTYHFIAKDEFLSLEHIQIYDDGWLRTMLQEIYRNRESITNKTLIFLLETFLYRKKKNTFSFIKKGTQVDALLEKVYQIDSRTIDEKFSDIKAHYKARDLTEQSTYSIENMMRYLFSKHFNKEICFKTINSAFHSLDLVLIHKDTPPKLTGKKSMILKANNQVPLTSLSLYLKNIGRMGDLSFKHYFGAVGKNIHLDRSTILTAEAAIVQGLFIALKESIEKELKELRTLNK
jgi:uncharacterized protein